MTSVDSGVDTGNDSNDSSVTQHETLSNNQINTITTPAAAAWNWLMSNNEREKNADEQCALRVELNPSWPINLTFSLPSEIRPTDNESSITNSGAGPLLLRQKALELKPQARCTDDNFFSTHLLSRTYSRKMKYIHHELRKNRHFGTRLFYERKMRYSVAINNTAVVLRLLNMGISPNNHDEQGRTPLHLAACSGYTDMVFLLLKYGADPNQRDCIGNTPLHLAIVTSKISVITLLVEAGTNVLSSDRNGYNPLQLAQTKLKILQNYKGADIQKVKEEVHGIINMLLAFLQKRKEASEQVESLSTFCSRLSLSNTSDQIQDDVKDLLANIDSLSITS